MPPQFQLIWRNKPVAVAFDALKYRTCFKKFVIPNFHNLNLLPNDFNLQHLKPTDFNDLHQIAGLEIDKNQIQNSTQMIVKHHEFGIEN